MPRVRRLIVGLALALLLAPTARAERVDGSIRDASLTIDGRLDAAYSPVAIYVPDAASLDKVTIHAADLVVRRWEFDEVRTPPTKLAIANRTAEYELHDVTVTITGGEGWLGAYTDLGGGWTSSATGSWSLASRGAGILGNADKASDGAPRSWVPAFGVDVAFPHVEARLTGAFGTSGPLALKAQGPAFRLEARENTTTIDTGETSQAGRATITWVLLESKDATLQGATRGALVAASGRIEGSLQGSIRGASADLDARAATKTLTTRGEPATLQGSFAFVAAPAAGDAGLSMAFSGELGTSSARSVPVSLWGQYGPAAAVLGALGILAAGILVAAFRHRGVETPLTADQCVQLANDCAEAGDAAGALDWTRRAIALAPRSGRLRVDEGYHLQELGRLTEALASYTLAAQLANDGEADYLAAVLLATQTMDFGRAEEKLASAFRASPALVLEAEDDPRLQGLLARPAMRSAAASAHRALDEEDFRPR